MPSCKMELPNYKEANFMSSQVNESKITYRKVGDYIISNIILPPKETKVELGLWGIKHKDYLMKNKRVLFNIMITKGTLYQYFAEVDKQAEEMFFRLIDDMAKAEGITEQLKAENQLEWVGRMNNIQAMAREIVINELIFT